MKYLIVTNLVLHVRQLKNKKMMNDKMKALMIGVVGAGITLSAYSQTYMTPTQCIGTGLVILIVGLFVGEDAYEFLVLELMNDTISDGNEIIPRIITKEDM
uniref:Uncharacterized protein n=1 Tax=Lactuca sativa TaxID=4236 RepID=A0A9R1VUU2_LACSA|nr:hypothetical protein LSAT_V11C400225110 [Lactuca sativa]